MRILFGAQSCGFGPVSKACAAARALASHERVFVGDTFAATFAASNPGVFVQVKVIEEVPDAFSADSSQADWVISVMNADLVLAAVAEGRRVTMVDSLFGFWRHERSFEEIAELVASAPRADLVALTEHLSDLSPHELILAAHMLADSALLQNFPGVRERAAEIAGLCGTEFHVTGSIVDQVGLANVHADDRLSPYDLVVNLGGFKNFFLDFEKNNAYLDLMSGCIENLLVDRSDLTRVLVCGGAFRGARDTDLSVGSRTAEFRCLPQRDFLRHVAAAPHYFTTPGLTALHEALVLERLPMALPEQHYGHVFNLRMLRGTTFEKFGTTLQLPGMSYPMVEDDFEGTRCIAAQAGCILEDPSARRAFYDVMGDAVQSHFNLSTEQQAQALNELRSVLLGPSAPDVLDRLARSIQDVAIA